MTHIQIQPTPRQRVPRSKAQRRIPVLRRYSPDNPLLLFAFQTQARVAGSDGLTREFQTSSLKNARLVCLPSRI